MTDLNDLVEKLNDYWLNVEYHFVVNSRIKS